MFRASGLLAVLVLLAVAKGDTNGVLKPYEPTWDSLDKRPLPCWYDSAKVGVFIHWGVFSVPSYGSEWFWHNWKTQKTSSIVNFMSENYPPNFTYQDFAKDFTAELFNASRWAQVLKKSGARYVVLTSKHHEGFTLWPSKYSFSWNAKDVGPHRDLVGELASAVRADTEIKFGLYHSLYEWFNPHWLADKASNFTKTDFVDQKIIPEMKELVSIYKPEVLWSDGDWEADSVYWRAPEFLSWLYNDSPVADTIVVNDRWGRDAQCVHGDFLNCQDRFEPDVPPPKKWENAMTIDRQSWGFRREATLSDFYSAHDLLEKMAKTVSLGGNFLMNIGPAKDGSIPPIYEERLEQIGKWLSVNGEAIYGTRPWSRHNDTLATGVYYTMSSDGHDLYATVLEWPEGDVLRLASPQVSKPKVTLLGYGQLKASIADNVIIIRFPSKAQVESDIGWALRITGLPSH